MTVLLGCIADDFTGATDLANTLVQNGMRAVQVIGVPATEIDIGDAEAVVVALKSRTAPVDAAVADSLAAAAWLQQLGARQFVFKYCSTFDSKVTGNIGPVADALLDFLQEDFSIVCPAYPVNGRTIYKGYLFVGDLLLNESPMKDHPLTPMRDANLVRLMSEQSQHRVGLVPFDCVAAGTEAINDAYAALQEEGMGYAVVDVVSDPDLEAIGRSVASHRLVTGGSGVALGLPGNFRRLGLLESAPDPGTPAVAGRRVVFAGSCSVATRLQIRHVEQRWPCLKLDTDRIMAGDPVVAESTDWVCGHTEDTPLLVYASADPQEVKQMHERYGRDQSGAAIERVFGELAHQLVQRGVRQMIVAGGETAGAIVTALGIQAMRICVEIDPGIPWTESLGDVPVALALKSGNFGGEDFFEKAFNML